jgi:hypothetical protein
MSRLIVVIAIVIGCVGCTEAASTEHAEQLAYIEHAPRLTPKEFIEALKRLAANPEMLKRGDGSPDEFGVCNPQYPCYAEDGWWDDMCSIVCVQDAYCRCSINDEPPYSCSPSGGLCIAGHRP